MKLFRRTRRKKKPKIRLSWKDVLLAIYQGRATGDEFESRKEKTTYNFSLREKREFTDDHSLAKILKISGEELAHHLNFLVEQELIKPLTTEYQDLDWPRLTKKGFDVAVKIEEQRETSQHRLSSLLLSAILTLTLLATLLHQNPPEWLLLSYVIVILFWAAAFYRLFPREPTKK